MSKKLKHEDWAWMENRRMADALRLVGETAEPDEREDLVVWLREEASKAKTGAEHLDCSPTSQAHFRRMATFQIGLANLIVECASQRNQDLMRIPVGETQKAQARG